MEAVGAVLIARNEGERLKRCVDSIPSGVRKVVYVDSGSTDGSLEWARERGLEVVELDPDLPFTAARARNAGFERLLELAPEVSLVQFVDGDCELARGWLQEAVVAMQSMRSAVVVCGRLHERHPGRSLYHRLAEIEWDAPTGRIEACGGIALIRAEAFRTAGGFRPEIVAGEEPELCARLRRLGGEIWRIEADMATHDAEMLRFGQWWRRMVRGGHAYTECFFRHRERRDARAVASFLFWGLLLPLAAVGAAWWTGAWSLLLLGLYPLQLFRIFRRQRRAGRDPGLAGAYAVLMLLAKLAETLGALRYLVRRLLRRKPRIIEYKSADTRTGNA